MALKILPILPAAAGKIKGKPAAGNDGDLAALFGAMLASATLPQTGVMGNVVLGQPVVRQAHHDDCGKQSKNAKTAIATTAIGDSVVTPSLSKGDSATGPPKIEGPPIKAASAPRDEGPPQTAPQAQPPNAGQTIDFSGQILDAKPAKDIPAPQPAPQNDAQDLLARMIARAANADRARQAPVTVSIQPRAAASTGATSGVSSAVTAAFQHAIVTAAAVAQQQQQGGQQSPHQQGNAQSQAQQQSPSQLPSTTQAAAPVTTQTQSTAPTAATQPAALTYSSVDPNAIVEQLVKGIVVHTGGSQTQVRLRLQPEHLGDVSLKLTVDGNTIAANVVTQNADVRNVLLANTHQLARSLADAGLALGNFSVDVSGGNAGFTDQHSQPQYAPHKAAAVGSMLAGEDESTWADVTAQPPQAGGPQALVLNHLV
jgi:flagellar hook-length control protein FliK